MDMDPTAVFVVNFMAIVPLAALLSFATEELSAKLGQTIGGLMNATFGNAVELIVSIVALRKGEIRIVQSSMLGSILSNILLVLGCCFIASGIRRDESRFNETVASTMSSLMAVAATSRIIPATLYASLTKSEESADKNILFLSRGTAIIMLILYCLYLYFQLKSHAQLFDAEAQEGNEGGEAEEPQILGPVPAGICLVIVTPFLVILGWIIGKEMTLHFQGFETVVFFLSVLVVNYLIQDGKSNYLEGCMCLGTFIIIAIAFYVYPDDAGDIGTMVKGFF